MVGFKKGTVFDRRTQENFYLSILIDLGVTYKRTLGEDPARNFFQQHDIPHELMARILSTDTPRRLTEWEASAMRVELSRNLDATRASCTKGWFAQHGKPQKN
jgi:hypothetical protein